MKSRIASFKFVDVETSICEVWDIWEIYFNTVLIVMIVINKKNCLPRKEVLDKFFLLIMNNYQIICAVI